MIKHIVHFKLKEFDSKEAKVAKINEIKTGLEALIKIVPELKQITVGININLNEEYDICLNTDFETMEDLHTYAIHPDHMAVSATIREVLEKRACVDYNY
jgi:hypothetical protein